MKQFFIVIFKHFQAYTLKPNIMKSILIICHHFIPYYHSLGGVIRVISLAEFFQKKGYKVYVLTSRGVNFGYFGYEELFKKLHVIYLNDQIKEKIQKRHLTKYNSTSYTETPNSIIHSFIKKTINYFVENIFLYLQG